jgi:hypothetical protein
MQTDNSGEDLFSPKETLKNAASETIFGRGRVKTICKKLIVENAVLL